jgi:hypothetical protein
MQAERQLPPFLVRAQREPLPWRTTAAEFQSRAARANRAQVLQVRQPAVRTPFSARLAAAVQWLAAMAAALVLTLGWPLVLLARMTDRRRSGRRRRMR